MGDYAPPNCGRVASVSFPAQGMIQDMPNHWQDEVRLFLGTMIVAGLAGILTGALLLCMLLGLGVYLIWH